MVAEQINTVTTLLEYNDQKNDPKAAAKKTSIEETIEFLINMGYDNGVEMARVINHVGYSGLTLFRLSSELSEKMALFLIKLKVKVNEIDSRFQTVLFQVSRV